MPVMAIVGRANVGKSTLFNRIAQSRIAIVEDTPGVTRDRIYASAEWLTKPFSIIDTGGIELDQAPFTAEIQMQAEIAINEADVIVFVTSGRDGLTREDEYVGKILRKSQKPVIVAVNKIDDQHLMGQFYDFYQLGFEDVFPVSAVHGIGVGDMLDRAVEIMADIPEKARDDAIHFALIGRPNVGKSSLTNAILKENRTIVSTIPGTTRDALDTPFTYQDQPYVVIDTAGMKKRGRIYENIERYAYLRAQKAIADSDVVVVLIDGSEAITEQDRHVAGFAHAAGKGVIIAVNKWDKVDKDEKTMAKMTLMIRDHFKFLDYAPIIFFIALSGQRVPQLLVLIARVYENNRRRVATGLLNDVLNDAQLMNPTTTFKNGRLKIYYASQVAVAPPTFVLFVNDPQYLHFSYERYLENSLRDRFEFDGVPLKIIARKRE